MNARASGLKDHTIQVYGPPGTQAMTKASWKVFDRDITLRMEEEGKPDPRNPVKATDIGRGVIYKDELVTISALKVPHSPFPDGEAFAYRFDTGVSESSSLAIRHGFRRLQRLLKGRISRYMRRYMSLR